MLILWLLDWLGGWYTVRGDAEKLTDFLALCMRHCYPYSRFRRDEGNFCVRVRRTIWRQLVKEAQTEGIALAIIKEGGLPCILHRYRRRYGLLLGVLLGIGVIWLSGRFVWRIEVEGTALYSPRDVIAELSQLGFGVGSYIPDVEVNALQTDFLVASSRFAWISVNLHGTTAEVEVVERIEQVREPRRTEPNNLVASADGQIIQLELRSGWASVGAGDVVRAGDLLVSGIGETKDERTVVACAEGRVWAQVVHNLSVEIPYAHTVRCYTEEKTQEKSIIFFGKTINLFRSTGIMGGSCDIIDNERIMSIFGCSVPIGMRTVTRLLYEEVPARRSESDARRQAEQILRAQIEALGAEVELLRRIDTTTVTEDGIRLDCTLWCIEDIAEASPITLGQAAEVPSS